LRMGLPAFAAGTPGAAAPAVGAAAGAVLGGAAAAGAGAAGAPTCAPHFGQNFTLSSMGEPQLVQNLAMLPPCRSWEILLANEALACSRALTASGEARGDPARQPRWPRSCPRISPVPPWSRELVGTTGRAANPCLHRGTGPNRHPKAHDVPPVGPRNANGPAE
jgi:hypothetical protein